MEGRSKGGKEGEIKGREPGIKGGREQWREATSGSRGWYVCDGNIRKYVRSHLLASQSTYLATYLPLQLIQLLAHRPGSLPWLHQRPEPSRA